MNPTTIGAWLLCFLLALPVSLRATEQMPDYSATEINRGAWLFGRYCILCHGEDGLGEGILSLIMDNYPSTNLIAGEQRFVSSQQLFDVIALGGYNSTLEVSESMPPYQGEIGRVDIELIVKFVMFLRKDTEAAIDVLRGNIALLPLRRDAGKELFNTHCVLCHGKAGEGDGRMAKVLKHKGLAVPANLPLSTLSKSEMSDIVAVGGKAKGRSPYMPPWGKQLSDRQRNAVVDYVLSLAKKPQN